MKKARLFAIALCVSALLVMGAMPAVAAEAPPKNIYSTAPQAQGVKSTQSSAAKGTLNKSLSGTYYIKSALLTSRYLDVDGGYTGNGGKVQIWGPTYTSAQKWTITHLGNGVYKILNTHSGKALEVPSASSKSGTALRQYTYSGKLAQKWRAYTYKGNIMFVNLGTGKALDVRGGKTAVGTVVQQYNRDFSTAQQWKLTKLSSISVDYIKLNQTSLTLNAGQSANLKATYYPTCATGNKTATWTSSNTAVATVSGGKVVAKQGGTATITAKIQGKTHSCKVTVREELVTNIASGCYMVKSALGNYYLDVDGGYTGDGGKVQLWGFTDATPQQWYITHRGNGIYTLVNAHSYKALDVPNGSKNLGVKMRQWQQNNAPAQQWKAINRNGRIVFVNVASGKALDVEAGRAANGTYVQQWDRNGTLAQEWTLQRCSYNDESLAVGIFNEYNKFRARKGATQTQWSPLLADMALKSAKGCARLGRLEHRLGIPVGNQNIFSDILQYSGGWKKTPAEVISRWEESTGHRRMMQCNNFSADGRAYTMHAGAAAYYDMGSGRWYYAIVYNFVGSNQSGW